VHAKQRRRSLQRDDEQEAAAAIFYLLCCTLFVWLCVCVCVCVYQCVLVMKTNATAASAISPYPRSINDSRCRSTKTDVVGPAATNHERTNGRTQARERGRISELLSYERTRGRSRARARAAAGLVSSNQRTNARARAIAAAAMVLSNGLRCEPRRIRQTPTVSQSVREPILLPNRGLLLGRSCVYCVEWSACAVTSVQKTTYQYVRE
jgi:hypothetical protein